MRHPWYAELAWMTARQFAVMIPLTLMLAFFYRNGWDAKDIVTVAVPLLSLAGFDAAKKLATKPKNTESNDE